MFTQVREKLDGVAVRASIVANRAKESVKEFVTKKSEGVDGILVTVGLCIIALVLVIVLKDQLAAYVNQLVTSMTQKSETILNK
jgi:hypothetical protein